MNLDGDAHNRKQDFETYIMKAIQWKTNIEWYIENTFLKRKHVSWYIFGLLCLRLKVELKAQIDFSSMVVCCGQKE